MNWVGGIRNRLMMKDDVKRQKEFFEKKKLQQRLKNLGLPLPNSSSEVSTTGSMDLVTLFIVNQIAGKKENKDPPKVAVLSNGSRFASKQRRKEPLVLPMSPCSPSQLILVESQRKRSLTRKRKYVSKLSPVFESAFSDNSASDYAPHAADALSPLSTSSASSGQEGIFPLQLNQQQRRESQPEPAPGCSPGLKHPLPREMINSMPWSCPSNLTQLETPSAAQVLFGNPSPIDTEGRVNANPVVSDALSQSDNKVPELDFSLNQSQYEEPFAEDVNGEMCRNDFSSHVEGSVMSKILLKGDTPIQPSKPHMVPDTHCRGIELPSCANTGFSCPANCSDLLDDGKYSPRCFSSDSSDNVEECCAEPRLKAALFTMNQTAESKQQVRPCPPFTHQLKIREETATCLMKPNTDNNQQTGSISVPFSHQPLPQTECKCITKRTETHEVGTQTDNPSSTEKCDTAIQCSLMSEPVTKAPMFNLYCPPVGASMQHLSTRGQTVHMDGREKKKHIASPRMAVKEKIQENWSRMMQSGNNLCDKVNLHPLKPYEDGLLSENRGKQSGERWRQKSVPVMKALFAERKEVRSAAKTNFESTEDTQTLKEITDILLLLKQKNEAR